MFRISGIRREYCEEDDVSVASLSLVAISPLGSDVAEGRDVEDDEDGLGLSTPLLSCIRSEGEVVKLLFPCGAITVKINFIKSFGCCFQCKRPEHS